MPDETMESFIRRRNDAETSDLLCLDVAYVVAVTSKGGGQTSP